MQLDWGAVFLGSFTSVWLAVWMFWSRLAAPRTWSVPGYLLRVASVALAGGVVGRGAYAVLGRFLGDAPSAGISYGLGWVVSMVVVGGLAVFRWR
jgi:hypothetical protein